jgi:hypothetical protein
MVAIKEAKVAATTMAGMLRLAIFMFPPGRGRIRSRLSGTHVRLCSRATPEWILKVPLAQLETTLG